MKALQRFSDEYLESCRDMTADQVIQFLEDFRRLHGGRRAPSKLISLKVPVDLLRAFKARAAIAGTPYQTQIKKLMRTWVLGDRP
jgi:predicted DNA binding CopG/RHH family protein